MFIENLISQIYDPGWGRTHACIYLSINICCLLHLGNSYKNASFKQII
jgi:hypothetical protein